MADVAFTHTEVNPSYVEGHGGGRRELMHTEVNPTYLGGGGGGFRSFTHTEQNPMLSGRKSVGLPAGMIELIL